MTAPPDISELLSFLPCPTPEAWIQAALADQVTLLIDHANCEKKAAATAMSLLHRHTDNPRLMHKMSRLAREELRHFEQVLSHLARLDIPYEHLSASRYAGELRRLVRTREPERLVDTLLVGAIVDEREP